MDYNQCLSAVESYVRGYFLEHDDQQHPYHNLGHTEGVVRAAAEIANHFQLEERRYFIVLCAAWFHDTGYFVGREQHEEHGQQLARAFLAQNGVEPSVIDKIAGCILATKLPQHPHGLLEEIVCDADLFHLGTDAFWEGNKQLRRESELLTGESVSGKAWRNDTIRFLESQHYWTDYCQLALNDKKKAHLKQLLEKREKGKDNQKKAASKPEAADPVAGKGKAVKKRPDRGIETMFRLTSANNQRLSDMADNKAHILVTVNSIILSAVISLLLRKLDANPQMAIPTYMILAVSVLTIIFSILATRPSISGGTFTMEDIKNKKVNLLFFGNFYKMTLDEYTEGMLLMMDDRDFLYGSLIKDVYGQGTVVARKYRLLRLSYNIFMYGLIVSVIAFVLSTWL